MKHLTFFTALSLPLVGASPLFQNKVQGFDLVNFTVGQCVKTSSGSVAGHAATNYTDVSEYLGIPYAKPPVGDLRFAAPQKYSGSSLLNGSAFGHACPQLPSSSANITAAEIALSNVTAVGLQLFAEIGATDIVHSEDCLFLNVWSRPQIGEPKKAVMVFIHGGDYDGGDSSTAQLNGAGLVDAGDVVVVSLNFRLGFLGFPGNPTTEQNLALLDQRLAVEWVRDNIANFGGDPERITLFGQSSGAGSVDLYSYAWTSDPIINGIILESGTAFSFEVPYSSSTAATNWYNVTATLGCGDASTNSTALLACMRGVDWSSIMAAVPTTGLFSLFSAFGPTVDNTTVFANYSAQTPANIPVLIGSNNYEPGNFRTQFAMSNEILPDSLWDAYNLDEWTCYAGVRANASIVANNPTWRYRFFGVFPNTNISWEGGAYHGSELGLIFGSTAPFGPYTPEEIEFQSYIQGAWSTFAKDPVNGLTSYGWPSYDPAEETLVRLGYENMVGTNAVSPMLYDASCVNATLSSLISSVASEFGLK